LAGQLAAAEASGQKAWIISHIPASNDCLPDWSNFHNTIVTRFNATIAGIFSGHTHRDQFELYFDGKGNATQNALAVGWIGPSVTPYTQLNPGWRVYTVDQNTFEVTDAVTYITDLSKAAELDQSGGSPTWFKEYSMRDLLSGWPSGAPLNATFFRELVSSFQSDDNLFQEWYQYCNKQGPSAAGGCSGSCKTDIIQDMMAGDSVTAVHSSPFKRSSKPLDRAFKPWNKALCRGHSSQHR
jgi:sphingomyelin phosphodiesterase